MDEALSDIEEALRLNDIWHENEKLVSGLESAYVAFDKAISKYLRSGNF